METEDEAAKTVNNTDKEKSDSDVESNEDISADESGDDDDSDDDIEEGGVDEELRKSVKAALGPAAVNSDDDVEEVSDFYGKGKLTFNITKEYIVEIKDGHRRNACWCSIFSPFF